MTRASQPKAIDHRLLDTAIDQFGRNGLEGASTRAIAAEAGTAMSSITYHYGGKEGLYLAAARHIAAQMSGRMASSLALSRRLATEDGAEAALAAALAIIEGFAEMMVRPESAAWARFVVREQMEPTEAFDILYGEVIGGLSGHLAGLVLRIGAGRWDEAEARVRTVAIMGQVVVFRVAHATALRITGWADIGPDETSEIRRIIRAHSRAILTGSLGNPAR